MIDKELFFTVYLGYNIICSDIINNTVLYDVLEYNVGRGEGKIHLHS